MVYNKPQESLPTSQYTITFTLVDKALSEKHLEAYRFAKSTLLIFKLKLGIYRLLKKIFAKKKITFIFSKS